VTLIAKVIPNADEMGTLELWFAIHRIKPRSDHSHADETFWKDHPPENGMVRTTCKKCGGFVGYRPVKVR
jgi:hypothetical protein